MTIKEFYEQWDLLTEKADRRQKEQLLQTVLQDAGEARDWELYLAAANEMLGFYREEADFDKAFAVSEDVLLLLEELQQEDTEHFAAALMNTASVYSMAGRLAESYEYSVRALQIYERLLPAEDSRFTGLYCSLSLLLEQMGENEKAAVLLTKALERMGPEKEAERAETLTSLALLKCRLDRPAESKAELLEALGLFEKLGPSAGAHYGAALAGAGEVSFRLKEYEAAFGYYVRSLAEVEKHFGRKESYALLCDNCAAAAAEIPDRIQQEHYRKLAEEVRGRLEQERS